MPFSVTVADLVEKTEKGRIVNRELWGDDDIFVAVDVYPIDNPKKRILCLAPDAQSIAPFPSSLHRCPLVHAFA